MITATNALAMEITTTKNEDGELICRCFECQWFNDGGDWN